MLVSPTIDLSGCSPADGYSLILEFHHQHFFWDEALDPDAVHDDGGKIQMRGAGDDAWVDVDRYDFWKGTASIGMIEMNTEGCNHTIAVADSIGFIGNVGNETTVDIFIPPELWAERFQFRFVFGADRETEYPGWVIDNVKIYMNDR
jgi:hypothetical protein